ncbi:MAG: GNAT family N-acetyltransferase [Anaerolineales bacterium]|nr:GNAT family N-acetyltransferase [Anaerolineales bacterium]
MEDVKTRQATENDYEFLYQLHRESLKEFIDQTWGWDEEWQVAYFQDHFDPSERSIIQFRGMDVGCLSLQRLEDHFFLEYIAILPEFQGKGIGSTLIMEVMRQASEEDIPVRLRVLRVNPARALYERLGFHIIEVDNERIYMETRTGD